MAGAALGAAGGSGVVSGAAGMVAAGSVDGSLGGVSEPPQAAALRPRVSAIIAMLKRFIEIP